MKTPTECDWEFPPPHKWPRRDFIVAGADLEPNTVLYAYAHGLFPMYTDGDLWWWSPIERGIIPIDGFHTSRTLKRSAQRLLCSVNTDFVGVMRACAVTHTEGQWINEEFIHAYSELHRLGYAHSVEVRTLDGELVGGVYGVRINNFFAGESMFHTQTDASKVALMHLVQLMQLDGMKLLDTQWLTDHLASLGGTAIPRLEYLRLLAEAVAE